MENKIKRPPSVLVAQTLLISFALLIFITALMALADLVEDGHIRFLPMLASYFAIPVVIAFSFLVAFWGMRFRKSYGRWMTVGLFAILSALFFVNSPRELSKSPLVGLVAVLVLLLPMLCLIYRLIFGKNVKAYFSKQESPDHDPPPPPSFDA